MNWPIARSIRASPLFSTTKREPEILAAASKSIMLSASPVSKCSFGLNEKLGLGGRTLAAVAALPLGPKYSTLAASSSPTGTSSLGRFGITSSALRNASSALRRSSSPDWMASLRCATWSISCAALASSLCALAWPICFDSALRAACASSSRTMIALRASSMPIRSEAENGTFLRCASARSAASRLALIQLMSSMAGVLRKRASFGGGAGGNQAPQSR